MKRTPWIVLAGLLVVASSSGCGTAENPMGPSFEARTAPMPTAETAVGTMPLEDEPESIETGEGPYNPLPVSRKKPKVRPVHPVHPEHPFRGTVPTYETAVGTLPTDEVPASVEDGMGTPGTLDPVNSQGQRSKPKKDHPVHPTHPEHPEHP